MDDITIKSLTFTLENALQNGESSESLAVALSSCLESAEKSYKASRANARKECAKKLNAAFNEYFEALGLADFKNPDDSLVEEMLNMFEPFMKADSTNEKAKPSNQVLSVNKLSDEDVIDILADWAKNLR